MHQKLVKGLSVTLKNTKTEEKKLLRVANFRWGKMILKGGVGDDRNAQFMPLNIHYKGV